MELTVDCLAAVPLLIGLWCESDDGGAFEWKPHTLKARYLPATSENVAQLLERLGALNFVRRFEIDGRSVGVVRNFMKWQHRSQPVYEHLFDAETRAYAGFPVRPPPTPENPAVKTVPYN